MGCSGCGKRAKATLKVDAPEQAVAPDDSLKAQPNHPRARARNVRLEICEACDQSFRTLGRLRCRQCGCFMEAKALFPGSKCPLSRW